ncbi:hypothetical protein NPIL_544251 [Nephila pilipes]|uniref:Uncharacterized protein n=1 Tax=Nephila pilipes TaxID=299642 RepID=A0A8X6U268_NEPPI|nr:hypothetical protein NPIL_544251 [Nephila pilipes]
MPLIRRLESAPQALLLQARIAKPPISRTFVLSRPVFVFAACLLLTMVRKKAVDESREGITTCKIYYILDIDIDWGWISLNLDFD